MRVLFVEHKCFVWIYATDVQCYILSCMNIRLVLSPAFMKDKVHLNIKIPNQRRKKIIPPLGRQGQDNIGGKTVTMCVPSCVPPLPLVLGSCFVIGRSGMMSGRGVSRHVPQCSYLYSEDVVYVCQIVMASVLTSHIPCLFLPALHSQPHGLHAVSLVQPVDGSHQGGALAAVGDRVK